MPRWASGSAAAKASSSGSSTRRSRPRRELEPIRPWLEAEIQRGLGRALIDAGRALSLFDSRPWAKELAVPAVVCVTTRDRLVLPAKQRALARALRAEVFEIDGDHDVTLVDGKTYAAVTEQAVARAAELLAAPASARTTRARR